MIFKRSKFGVTWIKTCHRILFIKTSVDLVYNRKGRKVVIEG